MQYLKCNNCGYLQKDDGISYKCKKCGYELLSAVYECNKFFNLKVESLWDYECIPKYKKVKTKIKPNVYKSEKLAKELNIKDLYIAFSGYFPEKGFESETGTFKDLEAYAMMERLQLAKNKIKGLIMPSSGNAARAVLNAALKYGTELKLIIPKSSFYKLWLPDITKKEFEIINENIEIIATEGDYNSSINRAKELHLENYVYDGGYKNPARRDGAGLIFLEALRKDFIPDFYVQAVGSATGAIGVYEMSKRTNINQINFILSQNEGFAPLHDLLKYGKIIKKESEKIIAPELINNNPPHEFLKKIWTKNSLFVLPKTKEVKKSKKLFENIEGIDIEMPSAVAVASLIKAVEENEKITNKKILLHITGGGIKRMYEDKQIIPIMEVIEA